MLAFTREQERQRREAQAKLDEAAAKERDRLRRLADALLRVGYARRALLRALPWHAEVVDLLALAAAVAEGTVPASFLTPNMPDLNAAARLHKQALSIPGVRAVSDEGIAARRSQ